MEEYLTVQELSNRIKYAKQSIYNLIQKGTFVQDKHYIKPSRKKVLFIWSAVLEWLNEANAKSQEADQKPHQELSIGSIFSQNNLQIKNNFNI